MDDAFEQPHSMDYELAARTEVSALRLRATIVQSQLALNYASNLFQGTVFSSTQHPLNHALQYYCVHRETGEFDLCRVLFLSEFQHQNAALFRVPCCRHIQIASK